MTTDTPARAPARFAGPAPPIVAAWLYVGALVILPTACLVVEALRHGPGPFLRALNDPLLLGSFGLTVVVSLIVVAVNSVFGLVLALVLVRHRFPGDGLLNAAVDLPMAVSPVIAGYMLLVLFGAHGTLRALPAAMHWKIAFAVPGVVLATLFVTLPFVAREVIPVLEEIGTDQEDAAATLGAGGLRTFFKITLPSVRWGLLYGVTLTLARALGEFGAVLVVGGGIAGRTETATQFINNQYVVFNMESANAAAFGLGLVAALTMLASELFRARALREMGRPS